MEKFAQQFNRLKSIYYGRHTAIKFLFVGAINTLFSYLVFSLLIYFGLHYTLAVFLATVIGVMFNFKTLGHLVFHNPHNGLLGKFILVYTLIYLCNIATIKILLLFSPNMYLNGMVSTIIGAAISFFLNQKWVFAAKESI